MCAAYTNIGNWMSQPLNYPRGLLPAGTGLWGGGGGALYGPQTSCTEQWVLWALQVLEIWF